MIVLDHILLLKSNSEVESLYKLVFFYVFLRK